MAPKAKQEPPAGYTPQMDEPAGIYISGIDRAGLETRASSRERTRTRVFRSLLKDYAETRGAP